MGFIVLILIKNIVYRVMVVNIKFMFGLVVMIVICLVIFWWLNVWEDSFVGMLLICLFSIWI